jgi:hypothetical protein
MNRIEFNPNDTRKVLVHKSKALREVKEPKEQSKSSDNGQNKLSGKR